MQGTNSPFLETSYSANAVSAKWVRLLSLLAVYIVAGAASLYLAFEVRFDFVVPEQWQVTRIVTLLWFVPVKIFCLQFAGQFRGLLSYFRIPDLYRLTGALMLAALLLLVVNSFTGGAVQVPRGVVLMDLVLSALLLGGFRVGLRVLRERRSNGEPRKAVKRAAIMGAGDVGATVVADMLARAALGLKPVLFLDDDSSKWGIDIHGVPVIGAPERLKKLKTDFDLQEVIIAMPSASHKRIKELVELAKECGLEAELVPTLDDITSGRIKASRLRPVEIEDLLGRQPVSLDSDSIKDLIAGKTVLVTGAGGSIGGELCRQILRQAPLRLVLVEQCEVQLFEIEQQLLAEGGGHIIVPEIADIVDERRMRDLLMSYSPQLVFHAAAHKHVPMMERQPAEAVKNNALGTARMADLASEAGVKHFVLISTDKAINPTNVMGATKRIAELCLQAGQQRPGNTTRFSAVRFGNVLGSSGSVIPTFRKQIAAGGPVKVTHPDVTRYFMTIREAAGLVLQCAVQSNGGEIFVLEMGQSIKIVELARQMIELSGYTPNVDIEIEFTGLRPGEKLYEELQHMNESYVPTAHPSIRKFVAPPPSTEFVANIRKELVGLIERGADKRAFKEALKRFLPEYTPYWD